MDLICAYDRVRRLTAVELNYLYLYMAYPEKFWKIANRYYNTHKAWVSGRNIEKLEKFIRQEDERERFLEMMRHFTLQPPASGDKKFRWQIKYDIMNPTGFILEVPVELRMRRKQRKKDDIINLAVLFAVELCTR